MDHFEQIASIRKRVADENSKYTVYNRIVDNYNFRLNQTTNFPNATVMYSNPSGFNTAAVGSWPLLVKDMTPILEQEELDKFVANLTEYHPLAPFLLQSNVQAYIKELRGVLQQKPSGRSNLSYVEAATSFLVKMYGPKEGWKRTFGGAVQTDTVVDLGGGAVQNTSGASTDDNNNDGASTDDNNNNDIYRELDDTFKDLDELPNRMGLVQRTPGKSRKTDTFETPEPAERVQPTMTAKKKYEASIEKLKGENGKKMYEESVRKLKGPKGNGLGRREKILRGEVAAGNDNPMIARALQAFTRKRKANNLRVMI